MAAPVSVNDAVFDVVDTGMVLLDGDRRVALWNSWMAAASGISAEAAKGRRLQELFADVPPRVTTAIGEAFELGASSLVTHTLNPVLFPLRTRTGGRLVHNISVRAIGDRPRLGCLLQVLDAFSV